MDASRTHEVAHGQSPWSWVLIGTVGMIVAAAILLALQGETGDVSVQGPAQAQAQAEPRTKDDVLRGRGLVDVRAGTVEHLGPATAVREGGAYAGAIPLGTPDSFAGVREYPTPVQAFSGERLDTFTEVREGGGYQGSVPLAEDPTPGTAPGR
ncbi:MAG TPA: hypothetical protein VG993_08160 [Actinomycetota bacterium]|jgi:hypothetical protein|nr:hypothetical protein [Actinomycetota bacterium]